MVSQIGVPLVSKDKEMADAVSEALGPNGGIVLGEVSSDLRHLVARLEKTQVSVALVDMGDSPVEMLAELDPIISRFLGTRFVVLSDGVRKDLILEAMEIGARYFLLKESIPKNLTRILRRLIADGAGEAEGDRQGIMTTILSASGGCGSTTLAVNVANELQLMTAEPSLLVDLDCTYGSVATHLGISGDYGIADVLTHEGCIDPSLIHSSALAYSDGLHVLMSPASISFANPRPVHRENLHKAFLACKEAYGYTVVDAPRAPMDIASNLAKDSDITVICFQLTVKDIRVVREMISVLKKQGVHSDSLLLLANRYRKRSPMIGLAEGQEALGGLPIECISNDYRSALRGINFGQPLALAAPRSTLRKDLRRLVVKISSVRQPQQASRTKHGN